MDEGCRSDNWYYCVLDCGFRVGMRFYLTGGLLVCLQWHPVLVHTLNLAHTRQGNTRGMETRLKLNLTNKPLFCSDK